MRRYVLNNIIRGGRAFCTGTVKTNIKPMMTVPLLMTSISSTSIYSSFSQRLYTTEASQDWTDEKFKEITQENKLVVFMKGTPASPQCGFSKYVIQILEMHGCEDYQTFNVLDDEVLRNRVKEFSNWPTIPQVYIDGEFIGGLDILLQMHQNGEIIEELEKIGHRSALIED